MEWFIAAVAIAALGVAAVAAAGGGGEMGAEPVDDTYRQSLPDRPLTAADLERARFGVTLRGYAMNQVDDLLERLGREIAERDARIAELTGVPLTAEPRDADGDPGTAGSATDQRLAAAPAGLDDHPPTAGGEPHR